MPNKRIGSVRHSFPRVVGFTSHALFQIRTSAQISGAALSEPSRRMPPWRRVRRFEMGPIGVFWPPVHEAASQFFVVFAILFYQKSGAQQSYLRAGWLRCEESRAAPPIAETCWTSPKLSLHMENVWICLSSPLLHYSVPLKTRFSCMKNSVVLPWRSSWSRCRSLAHSLTHSITA